MHSAFFFWVSQAQFDTSSFGHEHDRRIHI